MRLSSDPNSFILDITNYQEIILPRNFISRLVIRIPCVQVECGMLLFLDRRSMSIGHKTINITKKKNKQKISNSDVLQDQKEYHHFQRLPTDINQIPA